MNYLIFLSLILSIYFQGNPGFAQDSLSQKLIDSPYKTVNGGFGSDITQVGDINNDDVLDFAVSGISEKNVLSPAGSGLVHVFTNNGDSAIMTLWSPNAEINGWFGYSISGAGDVNNDMYDDIIISARMEDPGISPTNAGRVYVFSGFDGSVIYELKSRHEKYDGWFGQSVDGGGDVNNDGYPDIIIGARNEEKPGNPSQSGLVYVFSGQDGSLLFNLEAPITAANDHFGQIVRFAGDVNNDNKDDILVTLYNRGIVYLFNSADSSVMHEFHPPAGAAGFGFDIATVQNVIGDSIPDILIGAPFATIGTGSQQAGRAYLYDGSDYSLNRIFKPVNDQPNGNFGQSLDIIGDINDDGDIEIIIGSNETPIGGMSHEGQAYVFSISDSLPIELLTTLQPNQNINFSHKVAGVGDLNNDNKMDFVIGSRLETSNGYTSCGVAYVFNSENTTFIGDNSFSVKNYTLKQNYPNPFNPTTTIEYHLPKAAQVKIEIYNILGKKVKTILDDYKNSGSHKLKIDSNNIANGVYIYRIEAEGYTNSNKMILLK